MSASYLKLNEDKTDFFLVTISSQFLPVMIWITHITLSISKIQTGKIYKIKQTWSLLFDVHVFVLYMNVSYMAFFTFTIASKENSYL